MNKTIDPSDWPRIETILNQVFDTPVAERPAFLDRACGKASELREIVESLLQADAANEAIIDSPLSLPTVDGVGQTPSEEGPDPLVGTRVGRFRVVEPLEHGGMSEVYVGFDETLKREVALKALRRDCRLSKTMKARFLREARTLSRLEHPNICQIHEYVEGVDADFLVLELIDGRSLEDAAGDLDAPSRLAVAEQIARALAAAHAAGVVHRDLKPGNVMLTRTGEVKLLDFGLARRFETDLSMIPSEISSDAISIDDFDSLPSSPTDPLRTMPGTIMGTPCYMSPEQARGEPITPASDLFSLGLLLQTIFTGRSPHDEKIDRIELIRRAQLGQARPVVDAGLDSDLTELIGKLKSLDPAGRPTALHVAERLGWVRSKPRRRLRRLAIAAAVLIVAAGVAKYGIDLHVARNEAQRHRAAAGALMGKIVGDLHGELKSLGRLDIIEEVSKKVQDYYETLDVSQLTKQERFQRSQALQQISGLRIDQGNLTEALDLSLMALSEVESLARSAPSNDTWQMGLGAAHYGVGAVRRKLGNLEGTLEQFQAYRRIVVAGVIRNPGSAVWKQELAYSHTNLGSVFEDQGDLTGALAEHQNALELKKSNVDNNPRNVEWLGSLATTHEDIGKILRISGSLKVAETHYRESLAIRSKLVDLNPSDPGYLRGMLASRHNLGKVLESRGDVEGAMKEYRSALATATRLVERDPENTRWQRNHAAGHAAVGDLLKLEEPAEARFHLNAAKEIMDELVATDETNTRWKRDRAVITARQALMFEAQGAFARARQSASEASQTLEGLCYDARANLDAAQWLAETHLLEGRLLQHEGRVAKAQQAWNRALDLMEQTAGDTPDPRTLELWARALLHLDRTEEAAPIIGELDTLKHRSEPLARLRQDKRL